MKKIVTHLIYLAPLFSGVIVIALANYTPHTWLAGWDNLQTDLYPALAVKRAFYSSWQEYQSFGLVAGMGHAADLMRALFGLILSYLLPAHILRYTYHLAAYLIGMIGMYVFLNQLGFTKRRNILALAGALFYGLNYGTIQIFFVPFEPFTHFFASLPWLMWIFFRTIDHIQNTEKIDRGVIAYYLLFALINLLATPFAYLQTLFAVYLLVLAALTIPVLFTYRNKRTWLHIAILLVIIFIVNSFWILPQMYFVATGGTEINKNAKINQLATSDVYYQNREKGTIQSFIKLEGFYNDLLKQDNKYLFEDWHKHFNTTPFSTLPYLFATLIILGLFKGKKYHFSMVALYALLVFVFLNATPGIEQLNAIVRSSNLINQIFRSPFTKFIVPYSLVASYLLVCALDTISERVKSRYTVYIVGLVTLFLILLYATPAFRGQFFSSTMKVKIPTEYFSLMEYMKTQDTNRRIALLPDNTSWGWFTHSWGYNGSGFLWYGIEQPIVSRTFDVWSTTSESYYWEMKHAAESEDLSAIETVLEKYNIHYLLLDESIQSLNGQYKSLQVSRWEEIMSKSNKIKLTKRWGFLKLYEYSETAPIKSFVSVGKHVPNIGPEVAIMHNDVAYQQNGTYISKFNTYDLYYPYLGLTTQTRIANPSWKITEGKNTIAISSLLPVNADNYKTSTSSALQTVDVVSKSGEVTKTPFITTFAIENHVATYTLSKVNSLTVQPSDSQVEKCNNLGTINSYADYGELEISSSNRGIACVGYFEQFLSQKEGYLISIDNRNIEGRRLFFYILDKTKDQSFVEDRLKQDKEYYVLSPRYDYGVGYTFAFHSNSYENLPAKNVLSNISVYYLPYTQIQNTVLTNRSYIPQKSTYTKSFTTVKNNYYTYITSVEDKENSTLILNQSYSSGWVAFEKNDSLPVFLSFILSPKLTHVKVNNWANGWELKQTDSTSHSSDIVMLFWPQYLEYAGLLLAAFTIVSLSLALFIKKNNKRG